MPSMFQIPNFLHLTPAAIKKHCEALKRELSRAASVTVTFGL